MGLRRAAEPGDGDFGTESKDSRTRDVLGDVLGQTEDDAVAVAAEMVEHMAVDGRGEVQEIEELVVSA